MLLGVDHLLALAVVSAPEETDAADAATDYADEERHLRRRDDDGDDGDGDDEDRRRRHGIKTSAITRRRVLRCFVLGIRWGAGHSIGLATVCAVFFATRRRLNLEALGVVTDKLLGASMIVLGALSLASLHRWRKRRAAECAHIIDSSSAGVGDLELHVPIAHSESSSSVGVGAGATGAGVAMPAKTAAWRAAGTHEGSGGGSGGNARLPLLLEAGSEEHAAAHDLHVPHVHAPHVTQHDTRYPHQDTAALAEGGPREADGAAHVSVHVSAIDASVVKCSGEGRYDDGDGDGALLGDLCLIRSGGGSGSCSSGSGGGDESASPITRVCNGTSDAPAATTTNSEQDVAAAASASARSKWSLTIGVVHGVASPSGILGVLPGVVLSDTSKARPGHSPPPSYIPT